jgi:hypothetical protein
MKVMKRCEMLRLNPLVQLLGGGNHPGGGQPCSPNQSFRVGLVPRTDAWLKHHRAGDLADPLWGLLDMTPAGRGDFFPKVNYR